MRTLTDMELDVVCGGSGGHAHGKHKRKYLYVKDVNVAVVGQSNEIDVDDIEIKAIKSTVTVSFSQTNNSTITQS